MNLELGQRWRCDTVYLGEPFVWIGEMRCLTRLANQLICTKGSMIIIQIIAGKLPENSGFITRNQYITYSAFKFLDGREAEEFSVCFFADIEECNINGEHIFTYLQGQDRPNE